ncbi:unnamed protein product, partial [Allacma fusca]
HFLYFQVVSVLKPANESLQHFAEGETDNNMEAQLEVLANAAITMPVFGSSVAEADLREFLDDRPLTP